MRDEENNLPEVRNVNLTNNRFAELVSVYIQIKEKSEHQAILEYLKEQQKLQKTMQKTVNPGKPNAIRNGPQTNIQMKQAINSIHPSRQIRTKSYFHSHLPYRRRIK
ncbi:Hypothetical_protein [Hexamita inflata]|uniref:Hypothetical_protein n=1 Tax=Hexamita inflata TaxID=28002 RepID=A0AA86PIX9_9EUKA|nr:Hypothetical protein HINF_LOCUS26802 [Hexamita inflata]